MWTCSTTSEEAVLVVVGDLSKEQQTSCQAMEVGILAPEDHLGY